MKSPILENIKAYKHKYYKALLLRGIIYTLLFSLGFIIISAFLEYSFWFDSKIRAVLFFSFIVLALIILYKTIIIPTLYLSGKSNGMTDESAAEKIGLFDASINDKLLNYVQLIKVKGNNQLAQASIEQRNISINNFAFSEAINLKEYLKSSPFLLITIAMAIAISIWKPGVLIDSSKRIANFNQNYSSPALFQFSLLNRDLKGYKNENFLLKISTSGSVVPEEAFLLLDNRRVKMNSIGQGHFSHEFVNPQANINFKLTASGVESEVYSIKVIARPALKAFSVNLQYPNYTKLGQETLSGVANIDVPIGTRVEWQLFTNYTDSVVIENPDDNLNIGLQQFDSQIFKQSYVAKKTISYSIKLQNEFGQNGEKINHSVNVVQDQYPRLTTNVYTDTTLYSFVIFNGSMSDDYGINKLTLNYRTNHQKEYSKISVPVTANQEQSYYYKWDIKELLVSGNNELQYYLEVFDNDGYNGSKSTRSSLMSLTLPNRTATNDMIAKSERQAKENIDNALEQAQELEENIREVEKAIKGKKELTWKDENKLKEIIEKKKAINDAVEKMREQNKKSSLQKERFSKQQDRIKEKAEQLQKLMDELLDEETKKLYDELKKLLEEKKDITKVQEKINQLNNKEKDLEKELERALELFKRIQLEQKIEETISELEKTSKDQDNLSSKSKENDENIEDLIKQQEEINESIEEVKKDINDLNELNQDLKNPESIPDFKEELDQIEKSTKEGKEELDSGKRKKAAEKQQRSAEQMQELADKMKQMQGGMQMEMMQENLDHLRDVVHSLVKLSFDQETLMDNFRSIDQSDPRFVEMSQTQIKLKDDAKILEDSLLSLASRVFQISSFVTREVADMNQFMDESSAAIKERKKDQVVSKQQFAMTSMNNLALLLDDVLQQMQQQMADAMGKPQSGEKDGKNQPGMSELQQQLNNKIKDLKKGNKQGRQLSEELAELASEQEQLRKALEELQNKSIDNNGSKNTINDIIQKMEETEIDIVNKNITSETIKRQEEILSRLLQSEDALREQEEDEQREANQVTDYEEFIPKAFEEYIKAKEKEIELLKTIPPKLYPHYKNEVNEYFERVNKNSNN